MHLGSAAVHSLSPTPAASVAGKQDRLRDAFDRFVGETFYGQMIASMRKTAGKPAYLHGGRAEEIFQSQFDQTIAQQLAASNAHSFTGPMFRQFLAQTNPGAGDERLLETPPGGQPAPPERPEVSEAYAPWAGLLAPRR